MNPNDFHTDTNGTHKKFFSRKLRVLIGFSIFLTGFATVGCIARLISDINTHTWAENGIMPFAWRILLLLCVFLSFISLVKIAADKKPFSKILSVAVQMIGGLFLLASVVFPRLPDYTSSGFELLSKGTFVLIDGWILLPGLLLTILGRLINAGSKIQEEIDEII